MADSLVIAGAVEVLGGGVPSDHPLCPGAIFRLSRDFDLSSPPPNAGDVANMILPGDQGQARTITLPVTIVVPPTGDLAADRTTLAGARELLLGAVAGDDWPLTWTREGGDPIVFDCFESAAATVQYSLIRDRALTALLAVSFTALPYGRSTEEETINFPAPAQNFDQPPAPVVLDGYGTASNFLAGDQAGFDATAGTWQPVAACTTARTTAQFRTGPGALALTATSAASMSVRACPVTSPDALAAGAMQCDPGDTITVRGYSRAATVARSVNVGAEFYDSLGTLISTLRGSNVTNSTTVFTTNPTASLTAPANAAWAVPVAQAVTPANGEVHYFDDLWIDGGPVYSTDDPAQWSSSTQNAIVATKSARWSRKTGDYPQYAHTLPAAVDVTGRTKLTVWAGLATTTAQYGRWHTGIVSFTATLTDASGASLSLGTIKRRCEASQIPGKPHWQLVSVPIPQVPTGFDYTTVSAYRLQVWNHWNPRGGTGSGGRELQAGLYLNQLSATPGATGSPVTRGAWYAIPGPVGTAPAPVQVLAQPGPSSFSAVAEFTTAGSNAWTAPAGVSVVDKAESWGAGAAGGGSQSNPHNNGAGGGGSGEYAAEFGVPVTALSSYPFVVGAPGAASAAGQVGPGGGDSYWSGASGPQLRAHGGHGGWSSPSWGGGKGGSGSVNAVHYSGGDGCQANANNGSDGRGGGGGSSAGTGQGGDDGGWGGDVRNPGRARAGGGPGGQGGNKDGSPPPGFNGSTPTTGPGGGGGGGANETGNAGFHGGSAGRAGKGRLTYGAAGILPLASLLLHTPGRDAPEALQPLIPVGGGADPPDGREYTVPATGALNGRFDGTYTIYLVAGTWNSPAATRNLTVTIRQYPYSGGTAVSQALTLTAVVPNTDVVNGYVDMGVVSLPLSAVAPGNTTDSYFTVAVTSSNAADRFLDLLALDLAGRSLLVNVAGASVFKSIWVDEPDHHRNLGGVFGSDADRDRAVSAFRYIERISGGPFALAPGRNNRMLVYSDKGCPAVQLVYLPRWRLDRLA